MQCEVPLRKLAVHGVHVLQAWKINQHSIFANEREISNQAYALCEGRAHLVLCSCKVDARCKFLLGIESPIAELGWQKIHGEHSHELVILRRVHGHEIWLQSWKRLCEDGLCQYPPFPSVVCI
mgnify:CR=1 FL=1